MSEKEIEVLEPKESPEFHGSCTHFALTYRDEVQIICLKKSPGSEYPFVISELWGKCSEYDRDDKYKERVICPTCNTDVLKERIGKG